MPVRNRYERNWSGLWRIATIGPGEGTAEMRLEIKTSLGAGYTVSDLDGDIATEVVRSDQGLWEVLGLMRTPRDMIRDVIDRLEVENTIQIDY